MTTTPTTTPPSGATERAPRRPRRGWALLKLLAMAALGAGAVLFATWKHPGQKWFGKALEVTGMKPGEREGDRRYAHGLERLRRDGSLPDPVVSLRSPEWLVREGFEVERVSDGYTWPVNIVFAPAPPADDDAPFYYVNELHGAIRYATRDGRVRTLCKGLLNYPPVEKDFSDELGVSGMCAVPGTRDLLVTFPRQDPKTKLLVNVVVRLVLDAAGKSVVRQDDVLVLSGEYTSPSHQIQQVVVGPDAKVWVSVGDGMHHPVAMDLDRFGGKVLRMELDGSACADNPFYDAARPRAPRSYVWCWGVRNVFDLAFDPRHPERVYGTDNGVTVDRFMQITRGTCYGWNGTVDSMRTNALFCWGPPATSPTGLRFLTTDVLGADRKGKLFVALFGPDRASGLLEFDVDERTGLLTQAPEGMLQHRTRKEHGLATVLGLAEGPDGLYFTDFWGSTTEIAPEQGGVWRLFPSETTRGLARATMRPVNWDTMLPAEKGEFLVREEQACMACHVIDGVGPTVGPSFDGVGPRLAKRVNSPEYEAELAALAADDSTYLQQQRPKYEVLRNLRGVQRAVRWVMFHLADPRFDNPRAKMPPIALPEADLESIATYLMSRR